MLLRKLTLKNFGAYKGEQSVDLTTRPGRPIILIGGLNGCGKTTLLDSIQLALYGPRARTSGRGNRTYETYLRESVNREANPQHAFVTLEFSTIVDGDERVYKVRRSWEVSGNSAREFLNVCVNGDLDLVVSQQWADHVEDLLPLETASLFFFDGEKIESLADPERAASAIESAVHSLLGVKTVDQLRTDLLALQRRQKVSNEDQQAIDRIKKIEDEIREAMEVCADTKQEIADLQVKLDRAEANLAKIDTAFAREGGDLYRRRAELEAERAQAIKQLASVNDTLAGAFAAGPLPLLMLGQQLEDVRKQVEAEREAANAELVLDLLTQRDAQMLQKSKELLSEEAFASLSQMLSADREDRAETAATPRVLNFPDGSLPQLAGLSSVLEAEALQARRLIEEATGLRERINHLDRQLAGVPDESHVAALIAERDAARDEVARLNVKIQTLSELYVSTDKKRLQLNEERERAYKGRAAKLAQAEHAARVISYANRARTTLEKFGEALLKRHINRLEVAVLESFTRLMRKSHLIQDLRIDTEKFTLHLTGPDGERLDPARLSAGERQLLAVSLLWGLARVAGNRLPSVIDTPLGRLDSRHRLHLVERYFPHASDQVLLLSTDEEIDEYLLAKLQPSIARTYTLAHDDTTFSTTIQPGYWWSEGGNHVA